MHDVKHYPWQRQQCEYLALRAKTNSLPHALLLNGYGGLGKADFALAFAASILCEGNENQNDNERYADFFACGTCVSCKLLNANTHPDLFLIHPENHGKPIKIEQIRGLISELGMTAQRGGYRIAIINPADAMNISSANALLKTLEEPADNIVIILISSRLHLLPQTILSRCQKLTFNAPNVDLAKKWLTGKNPLFMQDDTANFLLKITNNAPLQALVLAETSVAKEREQLLASLAQFCDKKINAVQFAEKHLDSNIKELLDNFASLIMDIIKLKSKAGAEFLIHSDHLDVLHKMADRFSFTEIYRYLDRLLENISFLQKGFNLNKQLLLEGLCLHLPS